MSELLHPPPHRRDGHRDPDGPPRHGVARSGCRSRSFPQILPPQVNLTTTYTGADALTIEQSVATPIEQQMNGVDRMLYIQSTNANDGSMNQIVTFDVGTDIDIDNVLVNNRYSQAQPFLPAGREELRRHDQEVARVPADGHLALLARRPLRPDVPRELRAHQHQRRAPAREGRRRHPQPRRGRLLDADLAQPGSCSRARA